MPELLHHLHTLLAPRGQQAFLVD